MVAVCAIAAPGKILQTIYVAIFFIITDYIIDALIMCVSPFRFMMFRIGYFRRGIQDIFVRNHHAGIFRCSEILYYRNNTIIKIVCEEFCAFRFWQCSI
ncbi:hypothetical protein D9M68_993910 [compost metagenome]